MSKLSRKIMEIKNGDNYLSTRSCKIDLLRNHNPFFVEVILNQKKTTALIDTGADISIINKSLLPKDWEIKKNITQVKSVTGDNLDILGRATEIDIWINEKPIRISPFITNSTPKDYIIIGADAVLNNSITMKNCLKRHF